MNAFTPFPNFDPLDGDDRRVSLSRGNPCAPSRDDRLEQPGHDLADGSGVSFHEGAGK